MKKNFNIDIALAFCESMELAKHDVTGVNLTDKQLDEIKRKARETSQGIRQDIQEISPIEYYIQNNDDYINVCIWCGKVINQDSYNYSLFCFKHTLLIPWLVISGFWSIIKAIWNRDKNNIT